MNDLKLPELPPRYEWRIKLPTSALQLRAYNTEWSLGDWECLAYLEKSVSGYRVIIWELMPKDEGNWKIVGEVETIEQGAKYMWALVQLGEVHFTFRKDENERT